MTRQEMIDILGEARSNMQEGLLIRTLDAINAVRNALLDGWPVEACQCELEEGPPEYYRDAATQTGMYDHD